MKVSTGSPESVFQKELFCPRTDVSRHPQLVDTYDNVHPLAGEGDKGIPSIEDVLGLDEVSECLDNGFINVGCVLICDYVLNSTTVFRDPQALVVPSLCSGCYSRAFQV